VWVRSGGGLRCWGRRSCVSAYVDPSNVTTNVTAGAEYGYPLVWVVVLANAMACVVRYLSAKLGVVTARRCLT